MNICEHMTACTEGPCDVGPCYKCGALCPKSTWTPEDDARELQWQREDLQRLAESYARRAALYEQWRAGVLA